MTISSEENRISYSGNGVTTAFSFPYKFIANGDLDVYLDGTLKTITTHYTVTGAGEDAGGTVTFLTAPATGTDNIVILCNPAVLQDLDLVENDPLPAESLEDALDKQTTIMRRHKDLLDRAFILADDDVSDPSLVIPTPESDTLIGWNVGATALENKTYADASALPNPVTIAYGGTGATTASAARTALGLAIGTDVQAYDADTAKLDVDQSWTGAQRGTITTDNDLSFDLSAANNFASTPTSSGTLTFTNHTSGQSGFIKLVNGADYAIAAHANTKISTTDLTRISVSGTYILSYFSDGTNTYVISSVSLA